MDRKIRIRQSSSIASTPLPSVLMLNWLDTFRTGVGVDAVTGETKSQGLEPFTLPRPGGVSSTETIEFVQDDEDYDQLVDVSAQGEFNIEGVNVSASMKLTTEVEYSTLSTTIYCRYVYVEDDPLLAPIDQYQLTDVARNMLHSDPNRFREVYGDLFVAGVTRGSTFTCIFVCSTSSAKSLIDFKTSFGASAPALFSAEGSAEFLQKAAENHVNWKISVDMVGCQGTYDTPKPWTPSAVIDALNWFKANVAPTEVQAQLWSYQQLDSSAPGRVDVAPGVFDELSLIYQRCWRMRSNYASLPAVYTSDDRLGSLTARYQAVLTALQSEQEELATNQDRRDAVRDQLDNVSNDIGAILQRMQFYGMVTDVSGEVPANEWQSAGDEARSWTFGITSTWLDAVSLNSQTANYSEGWKVGHRESTFDLAPPNALIVGWTVVGNRPDRYNGSWMKITPQIILGSTAQVAVKSAYDRDVDWSLTIYYVDASDYQFEERDFVSNEGLSPAPQPEAEVALAISRVAQQTSDWCWAACAEMTINFLRTSNLSQTQIVAVMYDVPVSRVSPTNPDCNRGATVLEIQTVFDEYSIRYEYLDAVVQWDDIVREISAGRPLEIGIRWDSGNLHAMVIYGYDKVNQMVLLRDPNPTTAPTRPIPYNELVGGSAGLHGRWVHTFWRLEVARH